MTKKEQKKDFYFFFCFVQNLLQMLMPYVRLSHQHQKLQNTLQFHSKKLLEIIVSINTIVFIISKLDKDATSNLMIVMRKFAVIMLATH